MVIVHVPFLPKCYNAPMQKTTDKTPFIFIAIILILIAVCTYFYYTRAAKKPESKLPTPCAAGDTYNIMTGELCPGATPASPAANTPATTNTTVVTPPLSI